MLANFIKKSIFFYSLKIKISKKFLILTLKQISKTILYLPKTEISKNSFIYLS